MRDYQESVTTGQTHGQTDAEQSDPYVPLCFAGDTITVYLLQSELFVDGTKSKFLQNKQGNLNLECFKILVLKL